MEVGGLALSNQEFNLAILAGLNPIREFNVALKILDALKFTVVQPLVPAKEIAATVFEIGKIQRMFVEADYPVDSANLDVIWKRTIRSVPTFAFSINLEGRFDRPLQILKHAYDLWNSRPFLITEERHVGEAKGITHGLYHEFAPALKILSTVQVDELYKSKKSYYDLEKRYGLR